MPSNFAVTPTSTTTLPANTFPVSAVFVPGTASGNLTALQGGPASTDGNSYTSAPMAIYVADGSDVTLGTTTDLSSANTLIGLTKAIKANTASVVIGSGTVTANQGGAWTVTANAGNNLNTSALALDTSINGVLVAQGSTTSGEKGPLVQGAVTTGSPTYTTAQTSPLSLTTAGALRVDASATTQPVSGTFWQATQPVSGTVTANAGAGTFTVSGTVTSNIGTTNGLALDATAAKLNVAQGTALGSNTGPMMQGSVTTAAPTYTTGNINPFSLTTAGALRVDASATTQPISGTVTANAGTGTFTVSGTVTANQGGAPWAENITQFGGTNLSTGTGASGAGIPRVTVSNDSNVLATQSGTWTVQPGNTPNTTPWLVSPQVTSSGGEVPYHNLSAASTNFTNVKGSACQMYGFDLSNTSASAIFVKFYDKATAPGTGDVPKRTIQVPANGTVLRAIPNGLKFTTGFGWAATGGVADNDNTSIAANCVIDFNLNS